MMKPGFGPKQSLETMFFPTAVLPVAYPQASIRSSRVILTFLCLSYPTPTWSYTLVHYASKALPNLHYLCFHYFMLHYFSPGLKSSYLFIYASISPIIVPGTQEEWMHASKCLVYDLYNCHIAPSPIHPPVATRIIFCNRNLILHHSLEYHTSPSLSNCNTSPLWIHSLYSFLYSVHLLAACQLFPRDLI